MDERSDATEPPSATLAHDCAQPGAPRRVAALPRAPRPGGRGGVAVPEGRGGSADREGPVSAPASTSTLEEAVRAQSAPGVAPARPAAVDRRAGLVPQLVLAFVCAAYAIGAALGWGSDRLALIMGDFGLSAAAAVAAVSCFLHARGRRVSFRPAWMLFG